MGGCLVWTPVRTNSDDEQDESWDKLNTAGDDEDPNNCWYYRPSDFHQLKGHALRAGIRYLQSIQEQVDERKESAAVAGSRQFLSDAGILAAASSPTDKQALSDASTVIPRAVSLLRSWLREPVLDESGYPEPPFSNLLRPGAGAGMGMGMPLGGGAGVPLGNVLSLAQGLGPGSPALEDVLNTNFLLSEVAKHEMCPPALHRVGLGGLYYFTKMPDNNQFIYPFEARMLSAALARVFDFLPDEDCKEFAEGMREVLRKCGEDEMTMIQG